MSKKFYISDLHLGHNNIIRLDNRPFKNMTEMETTIINNWNSVVSDNDQVYILGDMFWNNDRALKFWMSSREANILSKEITTELTHQWQNALFG